MLEGIGHNARQFRWFGTFVIESDARIKQAITLILLPELIPIISINNELLMYHFFSFKLLSYLATG
jgi:hypothetical protein